MANSAAVERRLSRFLTKFSEQIPEKMWAAGTPNADAFLQELGRQVSPILEELAQDHSDKITFLKMNVDENPVTPSNYKVTGIPTINVYVNGELAKSIVGAKPKAALLKELAAFTD